MDLEKLLKRKNMTRNELSDKTGISKATISRYINGMREPKSSYIKKMASVLGVTTDELLGGEEDEV